MSEELNITGDAYASHGSGIAIPALLDRLFFAGENVREGSRLFTIGTPHIQPFVNARAVLYIEVFGILRSSMKQEEREVIEDEFKSILEVIQEVMKTPDQRKLNMDTLELYQNVSERMTKVWFLLNDFLQGQKQFYVRAGTSKEDLFAKELKAMKKSLN